MNVFLESVMQSLGVFGIALLMFLENVFPPIPSELIMPLAGYHASQGEMPIVLVVLSGSLGSLLGVVPWYYAGRALSEERLKRFAAKRGRWLTLMPSDIDRADRWFRRHGSLAVLLGRLVPTVRTLISVPAGLSGMVLPRFLVYSAVGTAIWTSLLALAGYYLGQAYTSVQGYVEPLSNAVLIAIAAVYLYRVATFDRRRAARARNEH